MRDKHLYPIGNTTCRMWMSPKPAGKDLAASKTGRAPFADWLNVT